MALLLIEFAQLVFQTMRPFYKLALMVRLSLHGGFPQNGEGCAFSPIALYNIRSPRERPTLPAFDRGITHFEIRRLDIVVSIGGIFFAVRERPLPYASPEYANSTSADFAVFPYCLSDPLFRRPQSSDYYIRYVE